MNTKTDIKHINIDIDKYQEITGCNDEFANTHEWDENNGIELSQNHTHLRSFKFKIIDPHKFFLAQIKYGL